MGADVHRNNLFYINKLEGIEPAAKTALWLS